MIKTLNCDKCHRDYEPYIDNLEPGTDKIEVTVTGWGKLDICPSCYKLLHDWWVSDND